MIIPLILYLFKNHSSITVYHTLFLSLLCNIIFLLFLYETYGCMYDSFYDNNNYLPPLPL
ncbi:hypothetical protein BDB00DRAFT_484987 [Zychaea mexicana]|uniref:uncharacterized protein n=1 Tax=Zychaea mexicana TaxID=64656 RepID=UPI0022FDFC7E|nr:uncharacterized protein BDB00DRAFT_484987 [Zychaea mexicana]KAI9491499.1 hypothetical protein BDB00DRAFT_484987 [Zychaea mexicana]